jgi:glycosyltransferase involved in cell wall biosynthesis
MKILWVKAGGLIPADTGGKIRSFNLLRQLAAQHLVTFFSFYAAHEKDRHSELNDIFDRAICIPLRLPEPKSRGEAWNYLLGLFSAQPYNIAKFCRPDVRHALSQLLKQETYDLIVCDFLVAAAVIPWQLATPKVLFTHNVEAAIWRRHFEIASNLPWKAVSWLEWRRMDLAERRYLRFADHVLAVSETDRNWFSQILHERKISVIPTGVDVDYFRPTRDTETANSLVFTGSMDWLPNEDAMIYFIRSILPLIRNECPAVTLEIAGRNPSGKLKTLTERDKKIQITGWVDDIRGPLARGAVCIVPLRIGGGTRLKIFEAMAMGKAVLSTSIGAEGLPVRGGENIILSDTPADFASSVVSLLVNAKERRRLGDAARKLVEDYHSWQRVGRTFVETLERVVARK